ncbi:hypothetical protein GUJ93_ZPchr0009g2188 [Zizania palustris]|uniref:Uncharacterized protein n=1 Tax=Zizania palustris TaxID=103762 RepID=A0A8J5RYE5_ZIZPA|nr:hypothetical protein GUJ93_ZPchr0009g2188 [Zizania palustris]
MVNYLPVMLSAANINWLALLQENSINSWGDLCDVFIANYQDGLCKPSELFCHLVMNKPTDYGDMITIAEQMHLNTQDPSKDKKKKKDHHHSPSRDDHDKPEYSTRSRSNKRTGKEVIVTDKLKIPDPMDRANRHCRRY